MKNLQTLKLSKINWLQVPLFSASVDFRAQLYHKKITTNNGFKTLFCIQIHQQASEINKKNMQTFDYELTDFLFYFDEKILLMDFDVKLLLETSLVVNYLTEIWIQNLNFFLVMLDFVVEICWKNWEYSSYFWKLETRCDRKLCSMCFKLKISNFLGYRRLVCILEK